jgi:hypothetical protein
MLLKSRAEVRQLLDGRRIGFLGFDKNAANLLRFRQAGFASGAWELSRLIDPSLAFRPRLRALAAALSPPGRLAIRPEAVVAALEDGSCEVLVLFQRMGGVALFAPHQLHCESTLVAALAALQAPGSGDEERYRLPDTLLRRLLAAASRSGVAVLSAYGEDLLPDMAGLGEPADGRYFVGIDRSAFEPVAAHLAPELWRVPVSLVLGTDWAVGKTAYLRRQMQAGAVGIVDDLWFALASENYLLRAPELNSSGFKGELIRVIDRACRASPDQPVVIKLNGRVEEFAYGFPIDRRPLIAGLDQFFETFKLVLVFRPDDPPELIERHLAGLRRMYRTSDVVPVTSYAARGVAGGLPSMEATCAPS